MYKKALEKINILRIAAGANPLNNLPTGGNWGAGDEYGGSILPAALGSAARVYYYNVIGRDSSRRGTAPSILLDNKIVQKIESTPAGADADLDGFVEAWFPREYRRRASGGKKWWALSTTVPVEEMPEEICVWVHAEWYEKRG